PAAARPSPAGEGSPRGAGHLPDSLLQRAFSLCTLPQRRGRKGGQRSRRVRVGDPREQARALGSHRDGEPGSCERDERHRRLGRDRRPGPRRPARAARGHARGRRVAAQGGGAAAGGGKAHPAHVVAMPDADTGKETQPKLLPGSPTEPTPFGKYYLLGLIARGGMAEVYRARRRETAEQILAVKCMRPQLAREARFVDMFILEGKLASLRKHPSIMQAS